MIPADDATVEATLCALWRDALNLRDIGADDSFVLLGGDSIAATLCAIQIHDTFGVEVPMTEFFSDAATLRAVARRIRELQQRAVAR